jgi:hypothetical protein
LMQSPHSRLLAPDDRTDPHDLPSGNQTAVSAVTKGTPDVRRSQSSARSQRRRAPERNRLSRRSGRRQGLCGPRGRQGRARGWRSERGAPFARQR